jgi:hypothetical protein
MSKLKKGAALVAAAGAAGAAFVGSTAVGSDAARDRQQYPAWFQNIHKSYGYDPRLTPDFDFASLYGVPPVDSTLAHHGAPAGAR